MNPMTGTTVRVCAHRTRHREDPAGKRRDESSSVHGGDLQLRRDCVDANPVGIARSG
ncbi:MAG TPA: hypothetical protein VL742_03040 [Casimicrobiaceae bacterium]|nr:hypothetical protein [Casimicrobiaceae bacterium]